MLTTSNEQAVKLPSDQEASGRTLGDTEIDLLIRAVRSGTLTSTKGQFVISLEREFAALLGVKHALACSSGTAAIHAAVAALDPEPGDEIITSPITDMGAIAPILYQGAIPVFADVDPFTCNVTAGSIGARLSERTRAIIVTHLFGQPCEMSHILTLASARGLPVIEDCAQAYGARYRGRLVGTFGEIGLLQLAAGKAHYDRRGGLLTTDDRRAGAPHVPRLINKAWGYGDPNPDHYFLALNYRMSELQGAVALAQLRQLEDFVSRRVKAAALLTGLLQDLPGIRTPSCTPGDVHAFWRYCLHVDGDVVQGGAPALGGLLKEQGIACAPRYIQKPAFQCEVLAQRRTFGRSQFPFTLARPEALNYAPEQFPGAFRGLENVLVLPWNERYGDRHVLFITDAIRRGVARLAGGSR